MACSINLQDKAIRKIRVKEGRLLKNADDVLAEIRLVPGLENYTLDMALDNFTERNLLYLQVVLDSFGYKYGGTKTNLKERKPKNVTDINTIFSSPLIDDLFDTLHIARQYFKQEATRMLSEAAVLNEKNQPTYTQTTLDLNKNIKRLKNELFERIVRFLKNNGVQLDYDKYFINDKFTATLYGTTWNFHNYDLYKEAIKALEQHLLGPNKENGIESMSGNMIPNIKGDIRKTADRAVFDAYNAAIMLSNFDNIVAKFFGKMIQIDYSSFNEFSDGILKNGKYSIKFRGETEEYFSNGTHAEEGAQTNLDELSERVISMMRHYDKDGNETGMYLNTSDFYSLASFIREFERTNWKYIKGKQKSTSDPDYAIFEKWSQLEDNPIEMLDWYIDRILDASKQGFTGEAAKFESFKNRIDIIQSIKKFIDPIKVKEKNSKISLISVLTQLLTNSYGANYMTFNAKKGTLELTEMHSHNAMGVEVQNSIYSHLLDTYSDIKRYWSNLSEDEITSVEPELIAKELKYIEEKTNTDSKLSHYIKQTLGIFVGTHGASELRKIWGDKLPSNLRTILFLIRSKSSDESGEDPITLHDKILNNETAIANQEYDSVESASSVIQALTTDKSVKDIIDVYLNNFILRPIMNISTLTGEQIPTYKLANLMYSDTTLLVDRYAYELEHESDITYHNLFTNLTSDGILGTSTGLEIINDNINKSSSKFNIIENFNAYFRYGFLDSFRPDSKAKGIHTLIGNYADKSTIMSKIISLDISHKGKLIIGKAPTKASSQEIMSIDEVLDLFKNQSLSYYSDLFNKLFDQYSKLDPDLKSKLKELEPNNESIFEDNVAAINEYLGKFKSTDEFLNHVANKHKEDNSVALTEELHYSFYNDKKRIALNQSIVNYYRLFKNDKLFKEFVRQEEQSLITKLTEEKGEFLFTDEEIGKMNTSFYPKAESDSGKNAIKTLLKTFGIKSEDYSVFSREGGHAISITPKNTSEKFRMNPILRRWMWTNNLFRNEYLNLSIKAEYMHPHKDKSIIYDNTVINNNSSDKEIKNFFTRLRLESSKRIPNMSKRNVSFTATYENGLKNSRKGEPLNVNVAVIKDYVDQTYNASGKTYNQDIHDGSSMIPYVYSRMIEESYPGKGYNGTKKRIATFVTEFGSALKKDAETVITNDKIRRSNKSIISLGVMQEKALGTIALPKVNVIEKTSLPTSGMYYKNGTYYKIYEYILNDGQLTLKQAAYNKETKKFDSNIVTSEPIPVNNLYDIWVAFGAEHSVDLNKDGQFRFSEGSNELLYDLVTSVTNDKGEYALKNAMIHIISNASAFKSGATNVNTKEAWTANSDRKLAYATYKARYMGPQLDANHEADASKIKEITQIVSALAQNPKTASIAKEVYDGLAKIIEISAQPYIRKITNLTPELKEKYYSQLSVNFAHALSKSDGTNLAKTISESFGRGALLPFSNQSFFREFARDLITKMNNEFIVRYYPGLPMVLNPSHNIIQIYEDPEGNIYAQDDLMLEAFNDDSILTEGKTTQQIFEEYLNKKFPPQPTTIDKVAPGNNYIYADGNSIDISSIEKYYAFKEEYKGEPILKVYNKPRDLKPSEIQFEVDGTTVNIFYTEPVRLRYVLNKWKNNENVSESDQFIIASLALHWGILPHDDRYPRKNSNFASKMNVKLTAWSQRNLHLLESGRIMKSIISPEFKDENGKIDFKKYFGDDPLINKRFDEVEQHYIVNNSIEVKNYSFKPAELMMPNIYGSIFDNEGDSIKSIMENVDESKRNVYFEKSLRSLYINDEQYPIDADMKLVLSNEERPVYIKYVESFPQIYNPPKTLRKIYDEDKGGVVISRLNSKGQALYNLPKNSLIVKEDDYDVVYMKIGKYSKINVKNEKASVINDDFEYNLKDFIKSFRGNIKAIIPIMSNNVGKIVKKIETKIGEDTTKEYHPVNMNNITYKVFKQFSGYSVQDNKPYDNKWFDEHKEDMIKQLALKKYISWQKSNEVVASRIPAQSLQSFMEMRNISYVNTESNDAYVSIWQIWLQGSDFDIDKAYAMGYSFDKNGQYVLPSDIFDYTTKEQLDAIESIPFPLGEDKKIVLSKTSNNAIDLTNEFNKIYNLEVSNPIFNSDDTIEQILNNNLFNINAESIKEIGTILRKIKNSSTIYISNDVLSNPGAEKILNHLITVLDTYNADSNYVKRSSSIKNSVVSKIRSIISSPSNYLLANEPVSVQELHDAGDKAKEIWGYQDKILSMWDMLSPYKQQLDASIGKADVGIGANGLKVFYALSNYYNTYYNELKEKTGTSVVDLTKANYLTDPKSFEKVLTLKYEVSPGVFENRTKRVYTIANTDVPFEYIEGVMNSYGYDKLMKEEAKLSEETAALAASGFVSGATDNAKELVMAKINAVESLASMHLYLISLGYSIDEIAIYMNSKLAKYVANKITGNLFESKSRIFVGTILDDYIKELIERDAPVEEVNEVIQFKDIYDGAQEFKVLASVLKVNQKTSANINELNKFLGKLESAVFAREHAVLGNSTIFLRNSANWDIQRDTIINGQSVQASIIDKIINSNPLLKKMKGAEDYVKSILNKASDIEVTYIDSKGISQIKRVSILGGQFDFRYYMHPNNKDYREAALLYYNLFKNTINIFDVIENSPHFKAMIDGVSVMNTILSSYSAKYNTAFNLIRDIIRDNSTLLVSNKNNEISHKFGNEAFPINIDEFTLGKMFKMFDNFMISKWTKSKGNISRFRFDVKELLKIAKESGAGVNSVVLFRNNEAKEYANGEIKAYKSTDTMSKNLITITPDSTEEFVVDLTSDYGIANFKIIMEEIIFKILKTSSTSSLSNYLKLSLVKNTMGVPGNQIIPTFNISDLNSPINMEKFQELLSNFNEVDQKVENKLRIVNAENKQLTYKDLFYIYNLVVNNEMYGNKRLTPLFDDYIKHEGSIGREYLEFSTLVDSGIENVFEIDEVSDEKIQTELRNQQIYSMLHSIFSKKGKLELSGKDELLVIKNSNFVINTISDKTSKSNSAKIATLNSILSILRNNNLIINLKCD